MVRFRINRNSPAPERFENPPDDFALGITKPDIVVGHSMRAIRPARAVKSPGAALVPPQELCEFWPPDKLFLPGIRGKCRSEKGRVPLQERGPSFQHLPLKRPRPQQLWRLPGRWSLKRDGDQREMTSVLPSITIGHCSAPSYDGRATANKIAATQFVCRGSVASAPQLRGSMTIPYRRRREVDCAVPHSIASGCRR